MTPHRSSTLSSYLTAFEAREQAFLHHYRLPASGGITCYSYTRGEFLTLARQSARVLRDVGVGPGEHVAMCMGANQAGDLIVRLASVLTGTVPVTINWQADDLARICYKVRLTGVRAIIVDDVFPADQLALLCEAFPDLPVLALDEMLTCTPLPEADFVKNLGDDDTRIVIFTSGTTGEPKGVQLSYGNYAANRCTFEQFLQIEPEDDFAVLIVNPLHHTNSTAITDWALRRPGSQIHLVERYSSRYWEVLTQVAEAGHDRLVAPAVARHFDFLENLDQQGKLPVTADRLRAAMQRVDFLIGSAPVGPTTVQRLQRFAGRVPTVRFGSTETCLQVLGIPYGLPEDVKLAAFRAGWEHRLNGEPTPGYYIGRPHEPHTDCRIVRSIERQDCEFLQDCRPGEPGYLITRGGNVMTGYVQMPEATAEVLQDGWYLGLRDMCFALPNEQDGELDVYWMSRDSALLIRGGANYAYDQINAELSRFVTQEFGLAEEAFELAVVGLKLESEHEDACCVTIELHEEAAGELLERDFLMAARAAVSKGAKPDHLRLAEIPRNFKGAILVRELKEAFRRHLGKV